MFQVKRVQRHVRGRAVFETSVTRLARPATPVGAETDVFPILGPFLAPREWLFASGTYFRRQIAFFDHFGHIEFQNNKRAMQTFVTFLSHPPLYFYE